MIVRYGFLSRNGRLVDVGKKFLVERAIMRRTTSYTEFNAALINRAIRGFNFDLDADRARSATARTDLRGHFVETGGLLISALVQYLDTTTPVLAFTPCREGPAVPQKVDDRSSFGRSCAKVHKHYERLGQSQSEPSRKI